MIPKALKKCEMEKSRHQNSIFICRFGVVPAVRALRAPTALTIPAQPGCGPLPTFTHGSKAPFQLPIDPSRQGMQCYFMVQTV